MLDINQRHAFDIVREDNINLGGDFRLIFDHISARIGLTENLNKYSWPRENFIYIGCSTQNNLPRSPPQRLALYGQIKRDIRRRRPLQSSPKNRSSAERGTFIILVHHVQLFFLFVGPTSTVLLLSDCYVLQRHLYVYISSAEA